MKVHWFPFSLVRKCCAGGKLDLASHSLVGRNFVSCCSDFHWILSHTLRFSGIIMIIFIIVAANAVDNIAEKNHKGLISSRIPSEINGLK